MNAERDEEPCGSTVVFLRVRTKQGKDKTLKELGVKNLQQSKSCSFQRLEGIMSTDSCLCPYAVLCWTLIFFIQAFYCSDC